MSAEKMTVDEASGLRTRELFWQMARAGALTVACQLHNNPNALYWAMEDLHRLARAWVASADETARLRSSRRRPPKPKVKRARRGVSARRGR